MRYEDRIIKTIWSRNKKFFYWEKIELLYLQHILKRNKPINLLSACLETIDRYERETKHELVAFLKEMNDRLSVFSNIPATKYLHYGLTSSDIIDTAMSLQIRESVDYTVLNLLTLKSKLNGLLNIDQQTIGRTHGKHAEPIEFKHRIQFFINELDHAILKFKQSKSFLYGKLRGPVGTASFVNKKAAKATLKELKLEEAPSFTQVIPRHFYLDTMYSCVLLSSFYERFATFIRLSAIDEINELQEGFSKGQTGSSAMPHKKNPISAEKICGLSRYVQSNFQVALSNINLWWERDISHSSNERLIWPETFHVINHSTSVMITLIENLQINLENMQTNLDNSTSSSHQELLKFSLETGRFSSYSKLQDKYIK